MHGLSEYCHSIHEHEAILEIFAVLWFRITNLHKSFFPESITKLSYFTQRVAVRVAVRYIRTQGNGVLAESS